MEVEVEDRLARARSVIDDQAKAFHALLVSHLLGCKHQAAEQFCIPRFRLP